MSGHHKNTRFILYIFAGVFVYAKFLVFYLRCMYNIGMKFLYVSFSIALFLSYSVVSVSDELIDMGSPETALRYIQENATYVYDNYDEWQRPSTTIKTMQGDCDDWAGLFASAIIAHGETATIVVGLYKRPDGIGAGHMTVRYKNRLISPQWNNPYIDETRYTIWYEISFQDYLALCIK